jgi:energy-coupling factor transporter ATP-binding protein EcfA2
MSQQNWFVEWAKRRMGSKRNFLIAIVGETGSGKSYMALRLGEVLDPNQDFNVSHVCFTPMEFFEALGNLKNNCFCCFDEAGISFSHREYMSMINKMLAMVFQTFRYKFINVIFTLPSLGYMDYVGRGLLHAVIRMTDRGIGTVYRVQKNFLGRNIYYPKIGILETYPPSKELAEAYEAKKASIMESRYTSWKEELKATSEAISWKYKTIPEIGKEVMEHLEDFKTKGRINASLIAAQLGLGYSKSYLVKRWVEANLKS